MTNFTIHIEGKLRFIFDHWPPDTPRIRSILFSKGPSMAAALGKPVLSPAAADVTQRLLSVSLNGGPTTTVDVTDPAATFACNEGDTVAATAVDVNAVGSSAPSPEFDASVPTFPHVPVAPTILDITFTPAP
jgi:hypothetical protein